MGYPGLANFNDSIEKEFRDKFCEYLKRSDEQLAGTPGYKPLVQLLEEEHVKVEKKTDTEE